MREEGFYWVVQLGSVEGYSDPEVALWRDDVWWFVREEYSMDDEDVRVLVGPLHPPAA